MKNKATSSKMNSKLQKKAVIEENNVVRGRKQMTNSGKLQKNGNVKEASSIPSQNKCGIKNKVKIFKGHVVSDLDAEEEDYEDSDSDDLEDSESDSDEQSFKSESEMDNEPPGSMLDRFAMEGEEIDEDEEESDEDEEEVGSIYESDSDEDEESESVMAQSTNMKAVVNSDNEDDGTDDDGDHDDDDDDDENSEDGGNAVVNGKTVLDKVGDDEADEEDRTMEKVDLPAIDKDDRAKRTINIKGFPPSTTIDDIVSLSSDIIEVHFRREKWGKIQGKDVREVDVEFGSEEAARKYFRSLSGETSDGKRMVVHLAGEEIESSARNDTKPETKSSWKRKSTSPCRTSGKKQRTTYGSKKTTNPARQKDDRAQRTITIKGFPSVTSREDVASLSCGIIDVRLRGEKRGQIQGKDFREADVEFGSVEAARKYFRSLSGETSDGKRMVVHLSW